MTQSRDRADGRRALLHMGMHKTGSTSIQAVWSGYKDDRIEYADLGLPNHSLVLQRAFLQGRVADRVFRNSDAEKRERQHEGALRRIGDALEGTPRSVILSGESLFRFDPPSCRRCVDFVRSRVDQVDALLYLRAPESFARSVFQERLKLGAATFALDTIVPAYRLRAMHWAEALGAEPQYVMFHRSTLHEGDVVADFGMRLGLDPAWARERAHLQNRNTSLSAEATAALYLLRHRRGAPPPTDEERVRQRRLVEVLGGYGTRRYDFGPEAMANALRERAGDVAWAEERLGRAFPKETVKDAVVWDSEGDVLAYGEAQAPALREHLRAGGLIGARDDGTTVDLLEAVLSRSIGIADVKREVRVRRRSLRSALRFVVGQFARARG